LEMCCRSGGAKMHSPYPLLCLVRLRAVHYLYV